MPYVSFSCLTALTRNSGTTLNRLSSRHPCLFLNWCIGDLKCCVSGVDILVLFLMLVGRLLESYHVKLGCKFFRCPLSGQLRKFLCISSSLNASVLKQCWNFFFGQMLFLTYVASKITHFCFSFFNLQKLTCTPNVVDVDANKVILNPVNTNLSKGDAR